MILRHLLREFSVAINHSGSIIDAVAVGIRGHCIETVHHDLFQPLIDRFEIPEITLPVPHPLQIRNRHAASVGQDVRDDEDFLSYRISSALAVVGR